MHPQVNKQTAEKYKEREEVLCLCFLFTGFLVLPGLWLEQHPWGWWWWKLLLQPLVLPKPAVSGGGTRLVPTGTAALLYRETYWKNDYQCKGDEMSHTFSWLTCIKMVKRPPKGAVWDVGEQRCHVTSVKAPEAVSCKYLHRNVPRLSKHRSVFGGGEHQFGFDLEAGQVLPLPLHHQLLRHHIYGHSDGLRHQGRGPPSHHRLYRVTGGVVWHVLAHQFISGDVSLTRHQGEGVHHEASVEALHTFSAQDLPESIDGARIERRPSLDLEAGADDAGRVDGSPGG